MAQIKQLVNIHSKMVERVIEFYRRQEEACDQSPLAPGKGSEIYVEMQLLTDRIRRKNFNSEEEDSKKKDPAKQQRSLISRFRLNRRSKKPPVNFGAIDEMEESRYDDQDNIYQREAWGKIFRGTGLRLSFKGGAGSGKSFTLSQEVRQRSAGARTRLENFESPLDELEIPIFVKASSLVGSSSKNIEDAIIGILFDSSDHQNPEVIDWVRHAFRKEDRGQRLFIVIDGLDELSEKSINDFRGQMKQLDELESASLVVSCRTAYFADRRNWIPWSETRRVKVVELAPLDENQQLELIEKLIGTDNSSKRNMYDLLKKNYSLSHFCRVPLIMSLVCWLSTKDPLSEKTNYASLYKHLTRKMLMGEWKALSKPLAWMELETGAERNIALQDRMTLLAQMCWHLFESAPSENRFTLKQWRAAYKKILNKNHFENPGPDQLLGELDLIGMIIDSGFDAGGDECYSFAHRTILEYFTACGLVDQYDEEVLTKSLLAHMWCESDWKEIIRFTASHPETNPTLLVRRVAKETGYISFARFKPLQRLSDFCNNLAGLTTVFLVLFIVASSIVIWRSNNTHSQVEQYFLYRKTSFDHLDSLWKDSWDNFKLFQPQSYENSNYQTGFIDRIRTEALKYYPLVREELINLYNVVFRFLQRESLPNRETIIGFVWVGLVDKMYFLMPTLFPGATALFVLGSIASLIDRRLLYWINIQKRDDIFRTGLRMQAEIVGHNDAVSDQEVERVINELLKTNDIYGAIDGGIPEDLLLLLASNSKARQSLNTHLMKIVNKKYEKINRYNRMYRKLVSNYLQMLSFIRRKNSFSPFVADDFKNFRRIADKLISNSKDRDKTTSIYRYINDEISADTKKLITACSKKSRRIRKYLKAIYKRFGLFRKYSKQYKEKFKNALAKDFNAILQDASLYSEERFRKIRLRTETRYLLEQNPVDKKLMHLKRLLLEDAYPELRKMQNKGLRFVIWFGHHLLKNNLCTVMNNSRDLFTKSDLSRALKALALLQDTNNAEDLVRLLEESALTTKYLIDERKTVYTFNQLDIATAKAAASSGNLQGGKKLAEMAERIEEGNENTPLAIKELSSVNEKRAIELAAICIKDTWEKASYYSSYGAQSQQPQFHEVLYNLPFKMVVETLSRLSVENPSENYFGKVLVGFLQKTDYETVIEWLQNKVKDAEPALAVNARRALDQLYSKPVDRNAWFEEHASEIKELLDKKEFIKAVENFHDLISYRWDSAAEVLLNNPEKIDSIFSQEILDLWFDKERGYGSVYKNLALLAKEPHGEIVKQALINWVNNPEYRYTPRWRMDLLLALGDLGDSKDEKETQKIEKVLLKLLKKNRRILGILKSLYYDTNHNLREAQSYLIGGLGKLGTTLALEQIERELRFPINLINYYKEKKQPIIWITYFIIARLQAERNNPIALKMWLKGKGKQGSNSWNTDFGDEPTIRDLAFQFGARITKVKDQGFEEYIVVSQSRNFKYRVRT